MTEKKVSIVVNGTFEIAPADQPRFFAIVTEHLGDTRREVRGCIYYNLAIDVENPTLLHLIEGWESQEALDAHLASASLKEIRARFSVIPIKDYRMMIYSVGVQTPYAAY